MQACCLAAAFLIVAYGVLHFVVRLPAFRYAKYINGELAHVTLEEIEGVVKRELKGNFFTLDLNAARAGFETLPWVRKVNARRQWPDRLEVELEEHVPLARWGAAALVNTHGEVFAAAYDGKLPLFVGPRRAPRRSRSSTATSSAASPRSGRCRCRCRYRRAARGRSGSTAVSSSNSGASASSRGLIVSSRFFERTVGRLQRKLDYVDLRYPNGFAVRIPELKPEPLEQYRGGGRNTKRG